MSQFTETSFSRMDTQSPSETTNPPLSSDGDRQNHRENSDEDEEVVIRGNVNRANRREADDDEESEAGPTYGAKHVIKLFVPVSICMLAVVATIESVQYYTDQSDGVYLVYTPFTPKASDTTGDVIRDSILNALIVLGVVVVMTVLLVLLYKYKCYKIIHGWLIFSTLILVFIFSYIYLEALFMAYNTAFDYLSLAIFIWNFGCMGMFALHWKAPLRIQQVYHIVISALLALVFIKYLPEWTLWLILGIIALWDLVAVLCPHGPLRILVNLAQERNENIFPSLIYSSTVVYAITAAAEPNGSDESEEGILSRSTAERTSNNGMSVTESTSLRPLRDSSAWNDHESYGVPRARQARQQGRPTDNEGTTPARRQQRPDDDEEDEEKGVKLGLGDFIFYSVLVGKASSSGDWATTIAAFIAILMGLFFTLLLLALFRKALPALPISIFFGLVFNFGTQYVISPFVSSMSAKQIFI